MIDREEDFEKYVNDRLESFVEEGGFSLPLPLPRVEQMADSDIMDDFICESQWGFTSIIMDALVSYAFDNNIKLPNELYEDYDEEVIPVQFRKEILG